MSSANTKYKSKKKSTRPKVQPMPSKTIVLISPEFDVNDLADSQQNLQIIKLKHPRNESAQFVYNVDKSTIHELLQYTGSYRSWFIGDSVSSNENVLISTPVDPLFLILPYFINVSCFAKLKKQENRVKIMIALNDFLAARTCWSNLQRDILSSNLYSVKMKTHGDYTIVSSFLLIPTARSTFYVPRDPFIANNKYRPFEELIHDELFDDSAKLECLVDAQQLSQIAVRKNYGDIVVWNYSEENTLQWLEKKIDRVTRVLKLKRINVANTLCAVSNTFAQTMQFSDDQYSLYAHGIISEYLEDSLSDRLLHRLNLAETKESCKRKANDDIHKEEVKRLRQECRVKDMEKAFVSKEPKLEKSAKKNLKQAAALAKAATGTKNISDFFKKK